LLNKAGFFVGIWSSFKNQDQDQDDDKSISYTSILKKWDTYWRLFAEYQEYDLMRLLQN